MSKTRQLAAIMFTDIVGYTAIMGQDEAKAFRLLSKNRQIQRPIVETFGGKWIKELGDGVMASFTTITDAVNAAHAALVDKDAAFAWLDKSYNMHEESLCSLKVDPKFDYLRQDQRYAELLKKIGLAA